MTQRTETQKIIIHCSDTDGGNAEAIRRFHMAPPPQGRGWDDIGYHFVIDEDGTLEIGRQEDLVGSHCESHNHNSLGYCLIGKELSFFKPAQFQTLKIAVRASLLKYNLTWDDVTVHYEYDTAKAQGKTCPNLNAHLVRAFIKGDSL